MTAATNGVCRCGWPMQQPARAGYKRRCFLPPPPTSCTRQLPLWLFLQAMVFSIRNNSSVILASRTSQGSFWQEIAPGSGISYHLRSGHTSPNNSVLIASESGLFYAAVAEGSCVLVEDGNSIRYQNAFSGNVVSDYFADEVYSSELADYSVSHDEIIAKVEEMGGTLEIQDDMPGN
ncbi:hypothetical protein GQ54DRAFT_176904 [Martensiomyces pterosporus]|nr:hypothetical protein GQ54DRAFT_176904 [Martensiomyces pterosporus]